MAVSIQEKKVKKSQEYYLYNEVRKMDNLYDAWNHVYRNVRDSKSKDLKKKTQRISKNPSKCLKKIQYELLNNKFNFSPQRGILIPKLKKEGLRPVIIDTIENKIVQRAILNILQSKSINIQQKLGKIPEILNRKEVAGGIPERGVATAIKLVKSYIRNGAKHYIKSDIKDFFTKIPTKVVVDIIRKQTKDDRFSDFFAEALSTELANEDQLKEYHNLFPTAETGVSQGSSLSVFSSNILLHDFDRQLNIRGIHTIRYIDDFVILGQASRSVTKAFKKAQELLEEINLEAYEPTKENAHKAKRGLVDLESGFDFLGCTISLNGISPSIENKKKLIKNIEEVISSAKKAINKFNKPGVKRANEDTFIQSLSKIDKKIRGWGNTFSFCYEEKFFEELDKKINEVIKRYFFYYNKKSSSHNISDEKRRTLGIFLLKDTQYRDKKEDI